MTIEILLFTRNEGENWIPPQHRFLCKESELNKRNAPGSLPGVTIIDRVSFINSFQELVVHSIIYKDLKNHTIRRWDCVNGITHEMTALNFPQNKVVISEYEIGFGGDLGFIKKFPPTHEELDARIKLLEVTSFSLGKELTSIKASIQRVRSAL